MDYDLKFFSQKILPEVYDDSLSYLESVNKLKAIVKDMIDEYKKLETSNTTLTSEYTETIQRLEGLQTTIDNFISGYTFADGSIPFKKLSSEATDKIEQIAEDTIYDLGSFVTFGITDDGHFCITIPDSWKDITFSTGENGELILEY